jgi:Tol biopolymer transport system component
MRTGLTLAAMALLVITAAPLVAQRAAITNDDADVMLQAAMHKEQVEGRLPEAIEAYRAVVAKAGSNKGVAAKALLQLAGAYEKLGRPEARATYQAIVRTYPDQPAVVEAARARLAAGATRGPLDLLPRRVLDGGWDNPFDISADGRFTVGPERVGYGSFSIVLRDVASGRATPLAAGSFGRGGFQARISNDGQRVAFSWWDNDQPSLRVVGTTTSATPTIVQGLMLPLDWSPDGREVLVVIGRYGDAARPQQLTSSELAWLSVESKSVRTIRTFESWQALSLNFDARVSADGQYVAFGARPTVDSADRYLYVIDSSGRRETAVVTAAGTHGSPVWTPNGAHLLFVSNSGGPASLRSVGLLNGRAIGAPRVVEPAFTGTPIGMTSSGNYYYTREKGGGNYGYVVSRRSSQGERPVVIPGLSASWSRTGSLAFVMNNGSQQLNLIVHNLTTGEERSIQHAGLGVASPRWLPDGSGVIVVVNERVGSQQRPAFHLVDLRTGTFRKLFDRDANGRPRTDVSTLAPDGKTLYLGVRNNDASPVTGIVGVDLATGRERPVATFTPGTGPSDAFGLAISPDGTTLAATAWIRAYATARIFTVGVDGSNYREIVGSFETGWLGDTVKWTPDGRKILFVAFDANKQWRIMSVPAGGGQAEFDGLDFDTLAPLLPGLRMFPGNFNNIDLSPDGSRIIASTLTSSKFELWTLDNLLSVINSR